MSDLSNYSELQQHLRDITHKPQSILTDDILASFQEIVRKKIWRDLKLNDFIAETSVAPLTNPFFIAATAPVEILQAWITESGREVPLRLVSRDEVKRLTYAGAKPRVFASNGTSIEVNAGTGGGTTFYFTYKPRQDRMADGSSSNFALIFAPQVYVYGMLIEVYHFLRDFDGKGDAQQSYDREIARYEYEQARDLAQPNAQMQGASQWV